MDNIFEGCRAIRRLDLLQMNVNGNSTLLTTGNGLLLAADAVITVNTAAAFQGTHIRANDATTAIAALPCWRALTPA